MAEILKQTLFLGCLYASALQKELVSSIPGWYTQYNSVIFLDLEINACLCYCMQPWGLSRSFSQNLSFLFQGNGEGCKYPSGATSCKTECWGNCNGRSRQTGLEWDWGFEEVTATDNRKNCECMSCVLHIYDCVSYSAIESQRVSSRCNWRRTENSFSLNFLKIWWIRQSCASSVKNYRFVKLI